jgi:hypothetical protein
MYIAGSMFIVVWCLLLVLVLVAYARAWWPFTDDNNEADVWQGSTDDPRLLALLDKIRCEQIEHEQWHDE